MGKAIVVRGRLSDSRHIELDEPVTELRGPVELVLRSVPHEPKGQNVFDLIAKHPPGTRSKDDIDRQVRERRDAWGDR
jgi:hypothetical protein